MQTYLVGKSDDYKLVCACCGHRPLTKKKDMTRCLHTLRVEFALLQISNTNHQRTFGSSLWRACFFLFAGSLSR